MGNKDIRFILEDLFEEDPNRNLKIEKVLNRTSEDGHYEAIEYISKSGEENLRNYLKGLCLDLLNSRE